MSAAPRTEAGAQLHERGYAQLEGRFSDEEVEFIRGRVVAKYEALGSPKTFANPPLEPAANVEISRVGCVFHQLGAHHPELAGRVLTEEIVSVAREVLGDDMHLEYTCAVLCNDARPFFPWHMHVGGVDNVVYRKSGNFPTFQRCERVAALVYLDDLDDETGPLLVHPRALGSSTRAPYDTTLERWEGQVEFRCPRGTVVLLDQCTWHAASPKRSPGVRAFLAFYFTASSAPKTSWVDRSLDAHAAQHPLLASVLPWTRDAHEGAAG